MVLLLRYFALILLFALYCEIHECNTSVVHMAPNSSFENEF